jgi:DNA-binding response OmpR family regulator
MSLRILVIEDNVDLAANLVDYLQGHGHLVDSALDGMVGFGLATEHSYDVIVLDLVLPRLDGLKLCQRLRREESGRTPVPVLVLTARDSLEDKIAGFESGADDYVVKPFAMREVEMRLLALARRANAMAALRRLQVGDLVFETDTLRVMRGARTISLPPIPLRLLEVLMRSSPRVLSRPELERWIWGEHTPDSDSLRAHMHVLRSAVDKASDRPLLHTRRGLGWQVADDDSAAT